MEEVESKLISECEATHEKLDGLILKTKKDFDSEFFSEKLTDIYLSQHQNKVVIANIINKSEFEKRLDQFSTKGEEIVKRLEEAKSILSQRTSNMEASLSKIKADLEVEHSDKIKELDTQKKTIDNDFKAQLKSLSSSYR